MTDRFDWTSLQARLGAGSGQGGAPSREEQDTLLRARARELSREPSAAAPAREVVQAVQFGSGRERFAIDVRYVQRIDPLIELAPLPGTPEWVVGITGFDGEVLPVFDLQAYRGVPRAGLRDRPWLLVLGEGRPEFAIAVEVVFELRPIDVADLDEAIGQAADASAPPLIRIDGQPVQWLDGGALLQDRGLYFNPKMDYETFAEDDDES